MVQIGNGGLAHVSHLVRDNLRSFEMLGQWLDARRCKYVLIRLERGEIKNRDQYDKCWKEAKEKIK